MPPNLKKDQPHTDQCRILVLHGPNLNMLGKREPEIYGKQTLEEINAFLSQIAERHQVTLNCFQSNHEGEIVDWIHQNLETTDGLIINAGAYTHTSIAIRDALLMYTPPIVEVHLSNIFNREVFRSESVIAPVANGTISGFGVDSYRLALLWLIKHLNRESLPSGTP
jgi:3-dehydroquinate dehydratase-2